MAIVINSRNTMRVHPLLGPQTAGMPGAAPGTDERRAGRAQRPRLRARVWCYPRLRLSATVWESEERACVPAVWRFRRSATAAHQLALPVTGRTACFCALGPQPERSHRPGGLLLVALWAALGALVALVSVSLRCGCPSIGGAIKYRTLHRQPVAGRPRGHSCAAPETDPGVDLLVKPGWGKSLSSIPRRTLASQLSSSFKQWLPRAAGEGVATAPGVAQRVKLRHLGQLTRAHRTGPRGG